MNESVVCGTKCPLMSSDSNQKDTLLTYVNHMGCGIEHNGPAKVSTFFQPCHNGSKPEGSYPGEELNESLVFAAFRGHEMRGKVLELPSNVSGLILQPEMIPDNADESTREIWGVDAHFKTLTYWIVNQKPSDHDFVPSCLQWMDLSSAIHDP